MFIFSVAVLIGKKSLYHGSLEVDLFDVIITGPSINKSRVTFM